MQSKSILAIAVFATFATAAKAQDRSSEKDILTICKGAHSYKQVSVAGKTTEVYVDDRQVAGGEIPHYDSLIQAMRTDVDEDDRNLVREDGQDARDRPRIQEIIQFVLDKKIVPDQAHLNGLVLTDSTFFVNGVKQPEEVQHTLKAKYPDWARSGISYGDGCGADVYVHVGDPE